MWPVSHFTASTIPTRLVFPTSAAVAAATAAVQYEILLANFLSLFLIDYN